MSSRFSGGDVGLEELLVGLLLDVDEVGDVDDLLDLREGLPDAEVVLDLRRHSSPGRHCSGGQDSVTRGGAGKFGAVEKGKAGASSEERRPADPLRRRLGLPESPAPLR